MYGPTRWYKMMAELQLMLIKPGNSMIFLSSKNGFNVTELTMKEPWYAVPYNLTNFSDLPKLN